MRFVKRLCWQFLGAIMVLINFLRAVGVAVLIILSLWQAWLVIDIGAEMDSLKAVPKEVYIRLVIYVICALVLHFLAQYLINVKEIIKDKVLINTEFHFSQEKINKFKKDMMAGNLNLYSFNEIYAMTKFLEKQGETIKADLSGVPRIDSDNDYIEQEISTSYKDNSDEESIISTRELNGYIHKGVSNPVAALDDLIGLNNVKEQVRKMRNRYAFEKKRQQLGTETDLSTCNHMCFIGPAGTGKTTVARIMSGILYDLKIIRKNQVLEINGSDLQGQYVGYTTKRTKRIIEAAKGGVLFIDEAYTLAVGNSGGYSEEALGELIKAMEDFKDDLVVIFAGYEKEMGYLLSQNSGMESRIKSYIYFSNYSSEELAEIFVFMAEKANFTVTEEFIEVYKEYAEEILLHEEGFGNARTVRTNLDETIEKHADNYASGKVPESMINILSIEDFPYFKQDNM